MPTRRAGEVGVASVDRSLTMGSRAMVGSVREPPFRGRVAAVKESRLRSRNHRETCATCKVALAGLHAGDSQESAGRDTREEDTVRHAGLTLAVVMGLIGCKKQEPSPP